MWHMAEHLHDHDHDHDHHNHGHSHAPANFGRAFAIGIALNLAYVAGEVVYGLIAHSLALLADAGHNFGDVLGLAAAWLAAVLGRRRPSDRYTYGLRRSSILAALTNAVVLLVVTGGIGWEAVRRLIEPAPVAGGIVMAVAAVGILINAATAALFMSGRKDDLNVRAAFQHMAADALVAFGVVVSGGAVLWTGWLRIDPAVSLIVGGVIVAGTWGVLRDALALSMDGVPPGVDHVGVAVYLRALPGVTEVHDLHIWAMSTTETALTAHLVRPDAALDDDMLHGVCHDLRDRFRIVHATLQVESGSGAHACALRPDEVV